MINAQLQPTVNQQYKMQTSEKQIQENKLPVNQSIANIYIKEPKQPQTSISRVAFGAVIGALLGTLIFIRKPAKLMIQNAFEKAIKETPTGKFLGLCVAGVAAFTGIGAGIGLMIRKINNKQSKQQAQEADANLQEMKQTQKPNMVIEYFDTQAQTPDTELQTQLIQEIKQTQQNQEPQQAQQPEQAQQAQQPEQTQQAQQPEQTQQAQQTQQTQQVQNINKQA